MITTHQLTRSFPGPKGDAVHAVRGIDLHVNAGETIAVLGPNGAGKSTLMRMLSTLLPPTSGYAEVAGFDVTKQPDAVRRLIGFVGQGNGASHSQRVLDEVVTQARIFGLHRAAAHHRAMEVLSMLGLEGLTSRKTVAMSGGQRRRLDLAMGLVHDPQLLFLDEPTTGLDPQNRVRLWDHLIQVRQRTNMTVLITTHYLDEADRMADRVVVVDHGEIIADGTPERLKQEHVGDSVTLTLAEAGDAVRFANTSKALRGVKSVSLDGASITLTVSDGRAALPALITEAVRQQATVTAAEAHIPTLDDVFLALTGRSLRDQGDSNDQSTSPQLAPQEALR